MKSTAVLLTFVTPAACSTPAPPAPDFDLVVANGRVIDPESRLDAVRHLGIRGARIEAVSETPLTATRGIDAANHVVAPGFVDHIPARMTVLGDPGTGLLPAGIGGSGSAGEEQLAAMEAILREGLAQGAVAVGPGSAYTPGAPITEIERMFRVAAAGGASAHIHLRGGVDGLRETLDAARSAGVPLHIVHVNSSAGVIVGGQVVGCRRLLVRLDDGTTHSADFRVQ